MVLSRVGLLHDLTPSAERLLERHLMTAKEWFPHEFVPWERAAHSHTERPFEPRTAWPPAVRSAVIVNLLTEDNLPYYFRTIERLFGPDGAWGDWARRWTAEEGRHSIVIRDYVTVTGGLDPIALERGRMHQVCHGVVPEFEDPLDGFVYVALQELATRIAHRNTGKLLDDPAGYRVMARVAADENLHFLFYRDLVSACMAIGPSETILAIERQVRLFKMPGTGIANFQDHAQAIGRAGIYDLLIHHDQILVPVILRDWAVEAVTGLSAEAEQARTALMQRIERIGRIGRASHRNNDRRRATVSG
jgi:acyl-[acyl-carrier-protein] desaturase